jgi:hypothetical protein
MEARHLPTPNQPIPLIVIRHKEKSWTKSILSSSKTPSRVAPVGVLLYRPRGRHPASLAGKPEARQCHRGRPPSPRLRCRRASSPPFAALPLRFFPEAPAWLSLRRHVRGTGIHQEFVRQLCGKPDYPPTISSGLSVGTRHCSTSARNNSPSIGPSINIGATIPSWRNAETKVMVFHCPNGNESY